MFQILASYFRLQQKTDHNRSTEFFVKLNLWTYFFFPHYTSKMQSTTKRLKCAIWLMLLIDLCNLLWRISKNGQSLMVDLQTRYQTCNIKFRKNRWYSWSMLRNIYNIITEEQKNKSSSIFFTVQHESNVTSVLRLCSVRRYFLPSIIVA